MQKYALLPAPLALLAAVLLAGCSGPAGPATVPVKGKLVFLRGGQAKTLADRQGIIEFASLSQPGVRAFGEIREDGSFELISVQGGAGRAGAVPGEHRVCLRLDATARQFVAPQFLDLQHSRVIANIDAATKEIVIPVWR